METTDTACVVQGNEIASTAAAAAFEIVEVVVEAATERFVMFNVEVSDLRVKEEAAKTDVEVSIVEEARYKTSADQDEVEKNINEAMKMETQAGKIGKRRLNYLNMSPCCTKVIMPFKCASHCGSYHIWFSVAIGNAFLSFICCCCHSRFFHACSF